jgi:serine/threonine-protein kinase
MATVFLAEDRKHDRQVAIKILAADAATGSAAERFQREIRLLARLQHPNILPVFDSGLADGHLWYAMPFVQGESLRARMERERTLGIGFTVSTLMILADALNYAHDSGVIHRDIKPENILLSHSIPLIADFGIASALDTSGTRLTQAGMAIGTPAYMSPEQASADPSVDGRTDIYSLGCVGFEMLAGRSPFEGGSVHAVIARMLSKTTPSIREVRPEVSPALEAAITRAIAMEPADRWQTGADFSRALAAAQTQSGSGMKGPVFGSRISMRSKIGGIGVLTAAAAGAILLSAKSMRTTESHTAVPATRHDSAVSAYRRGTARVSQRTQRTLVEGLALINEAIRLDSGYAAAWAARANAFLWARQWEFQVPGVSRDSLLAVALEASERALDLDSLDANAWLVSANV